MSIAKKLFLCSALVAAYPGVLFGMKPETIKNILDKCNQSGVLAKANADEILIYCGSGMKENIQTKSWLCVAYSIFGDYQTDQLIAAIKMGKVFGKDVSAICKRLDDIFEQDKANEKDVERVKSFINNTIKTGQVDKNDLKGQLSQTHNNSKYKMSLLIDGATAYDETIELPKKTMLSSIGMYKIALLAVVFVAVAAIVYTGWSKKVNDQKRDADDDTHTAGEIISQ